MIDFWIALQGLLPDAIGWLLLPISFAAVLLSPVCRRNDSVLLSAWLALGFHHVVAIIHSYFFLVPGGEGDAARFQASSVSGDPNSMDYIQNAYVRVLTVVYSLLGRSHFLGCELSILAFALSVVLLLQICDFLETDHKSLIVILFGTLPGFLFHTSVTLRESYQCLGLLATVLLIIQIRKTPFSLLPYVGLLLTLLYMSRLHNQLHYLAVGFCGLAVVWTFRKSVMVVTLAICVAGPVAYLGASRAMEGDSTDKLTMSESDAVLNKMEHYREGVYASRAHYGGELDVSSPGGFVKTFPPVFFLYMFAPLPWQISGLKDFYALAESLIRMALLASAVAAFLRADSERKDRLGLVLLIFLMTESFWSVGTINWGQAIRHRTLVWGLLVALGTSTLAKTIRRSGRRRGIDKTEALRPALP